MAHKNKHDKRKVYSDYKYNTSQRGFIVRKIVSLFKPSNHKLRAGRKTCWKPECTKEDVYHKLMNHIIIMKEKYPNTDGYICHYCKSPWTYKENYPTYARSGKGHRPRSKMDSSKDKNFSIDRWNSAITYTYDNIRFCCLGCNNRKSSSTPLDWKNFQEGEDDLN